jgi:parallel beta-helix repeat protein
VGLTFSGSFVDTAQEASDIRVAEGIRLKAGPQKTGRIEGTGTHFELTDSDYLDITLKSKESVHLMIESVPEMVVMNLEASGPATSTKITLSGFLSSTTYYKYEDNFHNAATFTTDTDGSYAYIQDLAKPHLVFIKPRPSTKFIPGDTSIGTWDPANRIYTLSTHVYETIQIDEDNLTLDGAGYTVTGDGSSCGVYLSGRTDVTVKNLTIAGFSYGIQLYNSTGNIVTENTTNSNSRYGICLNNSNGNTVTGNTASDNHEGIFLHNSIGNNLTVNTTSKNYSGIHLYYNCNDNTLTDNTASKNSHGIYLYNSSGNTLTDNTTNLNSYYGIYLYDNCSNNILTGNTTSWNKSHGIYLYKSSSNTLIGNIASRNYPGIYFYYNCNDNVLTGNTTSNNYYGIYFNYNCNNNEIYHNNFIDNQTHAYISSSTGNIFSLSLPTGGNYWSGWTTPNADGDALVDNPYVFTSGEDALPWVRQNAWTNLPPIADAGPDQISHPRETVILDGSGSSDVELDYPLEYSWQFTSKPEGSSVELSDIDTVSPSFTVDMLGDYIIELVVTDTLGAQSSADQVMIGTFNAAPVADAGPGQTVHPRDTVTLDGSGSSDPEEDYPLAYSWQFASKPEGSIAVLSDANTVSPLFTVDMLGDYVIELVVTDSLGEQSTVAEVVIGTFNTVPVADAGPGQTVHPRDTVTLDGSGSLDPEEDYPLAYSWQFASKPEGSIAELSDANTVSPSFTVDMLGDYVIELIVTDSLDAQSAVAQVVIDTYNTAPVADAGPGQTVHPRDTVTLDGNGSSDPEEDYPLAYSWQFASKPEGSIAMLSNANTVDPSFTVDMLGDYVIELVVTDSLGAQSAADQVVIGTFNAIPAADAGPDQVIIQIGTTVGLDGTGSSDPEGDGITYLWTITQKPAGSSAQLSEPSSPTPTFVADVHADFVITLVVTDEFGAASDPDSVTISFDNIQPVADAGADQSVMAGDTVSLDGSSSTDTNGDQLSYSWSFVSRPAGSLAEFGDPTSAQPSFVTDEPGDYVVSLVVNDGFVDSDAATVTITAISHEQEAIKALLESIDIVNNMDQGILKNGNETKDSMINKINAVLGIINQKNYTTAKGKLENDVLERINGCIISGVPDSDDWIITCEGQGRVYPLVNKAKGHLQNLI